MNISKILDGSLFSSELALAVNKEGAADLTNILKPERHGADAEAALPNMMELAMAFGKTQKELLCRIRVLTGDTMDGEHVNQAWLNDMKTENCGYEFELARSAIHLEWLSSNHVIDNSGTTGDYSQFINLLLEYVHTKNDATIYFPAPVGSFNNGSDFEGLYEDMQPHLPQRTQDYISERRASMAAARSKLAVA